MRLSRALNAEQDSDYVKALTEAHTFRSLQLLLNAYAPLAPDACAVVANMTTAHFREFRAGLKKERRGKFAGSVWAERYGAVMMPMPMLRIRQIADEYKVPFGVAWMRVKEHRPDLLKP